MWAGAGIVVIGVCNFTVSAWLALLTAARARDLTWEDRKELWQALRRAFVEKPSRFFWAPGKQRKAFAMPTA